MSPTTIAAVEALVIIHPTATQIAVAAVPNHPDSETLGTATELITITVTLCQGNSADETVRIWTATVAICSDLEDYIKADEASDRENGESLCDSDSESEKSVSNESDEISDRRKQESESESEKSGVPDAESESESEDDRRGTKSRRNGRSNSSRKNRRFSNLDESEESQSDDSNVSRRKSSRNRSNSEESENDDSNVSRRNRRSNRSRSNSDESENDDSNVRRRKSRRNRRSIRNRSNSDESEESESDDSNVSGTKSRRNRRSNRNRKNRRYIDIDSDDDSHVSKTKRKKGSSSSRLRLKQSTTGIAKRSSETWEENGSGCGDAKNKLSVDEVMKAIKLVVKPIKLKELLDSPKKLLFVLIQLAGMLFIGTCRWQGLCCLLLNAIELDANVIAICSLRKFVDFCTIHFVVAFNPKGNQIANNCDGVGPYGSDLAHAR
ncbi:hypothetical protein VNO78_25786 [Psophocarpus tetragonolobus]|uniref:Uncharacterized protein n=1 Tax=Psophocarpus tetragonolobus TaxID=3891 RepID=A0AAN9XFN2_PSOTE